MNETLKTILPWMLALVTAAISIWQARKNSATQIKIERIRAELNEPRELMAQFNQALSSGFQASQERRLLAIEAMWGAVRGSYKVHAEYLFAYDVLHPNRYAGEGFKNYVGHMSNRSDDQILDEWRPYGEAVEKLRPFLGERLWDLYRVYNALCGRI